MGPLLGLLSTMVVFEGCLPEFDSWDRVSVSSFGGERCEDMCMCYLLLSSLINFNYSGVPSMISPMSVMRDSAK